ncbi:response regulator transcription factor [Motiliproteus sp. MSK22-1]|uniref:response regulator transcription factor n=1 Tax=Motiliproteus sp. MSK22-1 TaxID=1897630 RepID=UPI00097669E8|nr:response regulator transcription factor [Motiliproteus sp. MSK22-1]OMH38916.1 DNA-binding response regulator [Motiliproteus sp. MSK22-1]
MTKLLLIDDDQKLGELLNRYFQQYEIQLVHCLSPSNGIRMLQQEEFNLLLLDVMLPEFNGFEACKKIRQSSDIPIIMLTARGELADKVVGLELGADDYLPKPFEPRELVARIQTILRRVTSTVRKQDVLIFEKIQIHPTSQQVEVSGTPVVLTTLEYRLLELLVSQPGKVFSRDDILNGLKGVDADLYTRAVDTLVSRLRAKLNQCSYGSCIKTVWGSGYCLVSIDVD